MCFNSSLRVEQKSHTMFMIRIFFSNLTTKTKGMCDGASKQFPNPMNSTTYTRIPPPSFEIAGSATENA